MYIAQWFTLCSFTVLRQSPSLSYKEYTWCTEYSKWHSRRVYVTAHMHIHYRMRYFFLIYILDLTFLKERNRHCCTITVFSVQCSFAQAIVGVSAPQAGEREENQQENGRSPKIWQLWQCSDSLHWAYYHRECWQCMVAIHTIVARHMLARVESVGCCWHAHVAKHCHVATRQCHNLCTTTHIQETNF